MPATSAVNFSMSSAAAFSRYRRCLSASAVGFCVSAMACSFDSTSSGASQ
ncbi:hypothetical protein [Pseudomonas brassicacearum]